MGTSPPRGSGLAVPAISPSPLRFLSYLAPSIPEAYFRLLVHHVSEELGIPATLDFVQETSGPDGADPFSSGEADVGFLCAPSYGQLATTHSPSVVLVPAAPVSADPRNGGQPVHFADVVVAAASPIGSFLDLAGGTFAYNDPRSLSGYYCMQARLAQLQRDDGFFERLVHSGSHLESLRLVSTGQVDGAAIDSNVLRLRQAADPELRRRLRVLESWGPFPIQPVVARASLPDALPVSIAEVLLRAHQAPHVGAALGQFGVDRFVPVSAALYQGLGVTPV
jgi:phosphonate transport system substrate-binding protein